MPHDQTAYLPARLRAYAAGRADNFHEVDDGMRLAASELERLSEECRRLQAVLDSRPAINAGLPETYIRWSQSIYVMEAAYASEQKQ